ncbi:GDSL Lipase/Acylhydrolase family protein [Metarhizium acridum CQMa 102]|uniref:GDSL Lipase/Acylhydrolase family protein n=1 Tax=Metarhizium acridum (strain CQMa 102) TaxID=655827 RepID=E9E6U2_METAQ|nr:GDSL Lipase/Acylhydrolase family protein [Metarhizium acridum CQMa 102]EFY88381.1 GDSL Lipase/Acylhydrolase family protein [Metarhizium acridum CQMa 102]
MYNMQGWTNGSVDSRPLHCAIVENLPAEEIEKPPPEIGPRGSASEVLEEALGKLDWSLQCSHDFSDKGDRAAILCLRFPHPALSMQQPGGSRGFNSEQGLRVLPKIMPDPQQTRVRFMAILFGSNDACFPDAENGQHVPLDQYKKNLVKLLTHPALEAHNPRLLLVTPPPIEERRLDHRVKSQGYLKLNRSNVVTKQYANASREIAKEMKVGCVDLWTAFMSKAGWQTGDPLYGSQCLPENDAIRALIHDGRPYLILLAGHNSANSHCEGLHFTPEAYKIFFEEVMKVIASTWPDQMPEQLPYVIPAWDDGAAWAEEGLSMGKNTVVRHD